MTISADQIEHTLLRPDATPEDTDQTCEEALRLGIPTVCVLPRDVRRVRERYPALVCCTVANFPAGDDPLVLVLEQIDDELQAGAQHIDVVCPQALIGTDHVQLAEELRQLADRIHAGDAIAKVIIETAPLDVEMAGAVAKLAVEAGFDYVKTSTGFHPAGGATIEAVRVLAAAGAPLGVKASGGIRTRSEAEAMVAAGATRIGASQSAIILGR